MKRTITVTWLASILLLSSFTGCLVPKDVFIQGFVDCLVQMNAEALNEMESRLEVIDRNLYTTEEKLLKLEQIVTPALEWIEHQKVELLSTYKYGSWYRRVMPEGLARLKNEQYEVIALEVSLYNIGTPQEELRPVLHIFDVEAQAPCEWEMTKSELMCRKAALEQEREAILDAARLSTSTLSNAIQYSGGWKVSRVSNDIYSISGYGLGMAGELTKGTWTYYQTSRQALPTDQQSEMLRKIIAGESPGTGYQTTQRD